MLHVALSGGFLSIGAISFTAPWALAGLLLLPGLWWLLRVVPPSPRRQSFPAIALLFGLLTEQRTAARTPLWLVILRMVVATLVILAVAHPVEDAKPVGFQGPLLLAVDNGWGAARDWPARRSAIASLLDEADRSGRQVILLPTAPSPDGNPIAPIGPQGAVEAKPIAEALRPRPWPTDRAAATKALATLSHTGAMRVVWVSDELDDPGAGAFGRALTALGSLELVQPPRLGMARLVMPPHLDANGDLLAPIRRAAAGQSDRVTIRATDPAGHALAVAQAEFGIGDETTTARFSLPTELRNRVGRLAIDGEDSAGAVALLDERDQRHPVGLVDEGGGSSSPLLDDLYYTERALSPFAEVRRAGVDELLKRDLSLIILPDRGAVSQDHLAALRAWVDKGGVLLRLAGPDLARSPDSLLPVRLLGGGRTLGGAMSWTQPMAVAAMPDHSPFSGLNVPADLRIDSQVLAEPSVDLDGKTWARLTDGTPLVTGSAMGKGWIVLLHTTVWPEWSNLGLSGFYPGMLQRLLQLSQGVAAGAPNHPLAPSALLDGYGQLVAPTGVVESLPAASANGQPGQLVTVGPHHPPGLYGDDSLRLALNLGPAVTKLAPLVPPPGARLQTLGGGTTETDLQPYLLAAALILLLLDLALVLLMRGRVRRVASIGAAALLLCVGFGQAAHADGSDTVANALSTRLAYVLSGDAQVDQTSKDGLTALTRLMSVRTTASFAAPVGVTPGKDELAVLPLLYWPVMPNSGPLTAQARDAVNDYMHRGGMILFDTRDGGQDNTAMRQLSQGLDIPALAAVNQQHVLTHAFYILRTLPGRLVGAPVYVQDGPNPANDDVSPVVIGANDWAAAWAQDAAGQPEFAVIPGGEQQRELAYRFGVNMVMYALTGSYKADQVHLPALLERLGE